MLCSEFAPNLQAFVKNSLEEIEYAAKKELPVSQGTTTFLLDWPIIC